MTAPDVQRQLRDEARSAALAEEARRRRSARLAAVTAGLVVIGAAATGAAVMSDNDTENGPAQLRATSAWAPRYDQMPSTMAHLNFPDVGDESYHAHALLSIFVRGEQVTVPPEIGIDRAGGLISPIHTHDDTGVVHLEADEPYPFTLEQVFAIWGQSMSSSQLGPERTGAGEQVHVYVNGEPAAPDTQISDRDNIVVAVGQPETFPTAPPDDALDAH